MNNNTVVAILSTLAIAAFGIVVLMFLVTRAPASAICLTKQEARAIWPRQHLYWYSKDHCWSNRRGPPTGRTDNRAQEVMPQAEKRSENKKPKDEKPLPQTGGADANGNKSHKVKIVRWDEYNEIDAMADREPFFRKDAFALWPPVLDTWNYFWTYRTGDLKWP